MHVLTLYGGTVVSRLTLSSRSHSRSHTLRSSARSVSRSSRAVSQVATWPHPSGPTLFLNELKLGQKASDPHFVLLRGSIHELRSERRHLPETLLLHWLEMLLWENGLYPRRTATRAAQRRRWQPRWRRRLRWSLSLQRRHRWRWRWPRRRLLRQGRCGRLFVLDLCAVLVVIEDDSVLVIT